MGAHFPTNITTPGIYVFSHIGTPGRFVTRLVLNMTYEEIAFLRESNNIEGVWDDLSLQQSIHAWEYIKKFKRLTPYNVKKTHKILMLHQKLRPDEKGYFRKAAVWVGGREGLSFPEIPSAIQNWCDVVNANVAAHFEDSHIMTHISYERIHPFIDGNGRTGRIFMNWMRYKMHEPLVIIEEKKKGEYYAWF